MGIKGCQNSQKCEAVREGWGTLDDRKDEVDRLTSLLQNGPEGRDWNKGEKTARELAKNALESTIAPLETRLQNNLQSIRA